MFKVVPSQVTKSLDSLTEKRESKDDNTPAPTHNRFYFPLCFLGEQDGSVKMGSEITSDQ